MGSLHSAAASLATLVQMRVHTQTLSSLQGSSSLPPGDSLPIKFYVLPPQDRLGIVQMRQGVEIKVTP